MRRDDTDDAPMPPLVPFGVAVLLAVCGAILMTTFAYVAWRLHGIQAEEVAAWEAELARGRAELEAAGRAAQAEWEAQAARDAADPQGAKERGERMGKELTEQAREIEEGRERQQAKRLNAAKFRAVQKGMTYKQVVGILGSPGLEESRSQNAGVVTVVVGWKNWTFPVVGTVTVTFENGAVTTKEQTGLE